MYIHGYKQATLYEGLQSDGSDGPRSVLPPALYHARSAEVWIPKAGLKTGVPEEIKAVLVSLGTR